MSKKRSTLILILFVIIFIAINYSWLDSLVVKEFSGENNRENAFVFRIIDGDTIEIENKTGVRFLGINAPEKGERYYLEAKQFLENEILNKTIQLEFGKDKTDKYNRTLAYVYVNGKNINLEQVKNGFANFYSPEEKDIHYAEFKSAWNECIKNNLNLCEKSNDNCANCVGLKKWDVKNQEAVFSNNCDFDCSLTGWSIKDEGRKKFIFNNFILKQGKEVVVKVGDGKNTNGVLFWTGEKYVWTASGDTLFLRDANGKLVLWKNY